MTRDDSSLSDGGRPGLVTDFLSRVPDPLSDAVERLLGRPGGSREALVSALERYTAEVDAAARGRRDLDVDLAEAIRKALAELLENVWSELDDDRRRLVRLAFAYYVDADDGDGDLESVFGFDDDALVLNLVLDAIGRPELKVRV